MSFRLFPFLVLALIAFTTSTAHASHCPRDVGAILTALQNANHLKKQNIGKAEQFKLKNNAEKGLALHKAGKHDKAEEMLHKVMERLELKH